MTGVFTLYGDQIELYADPLVLYFTPPAPSGSGAGGLLRRRRR
jgi:hypothetical protein